jgi:hypothetical protein
LVDPFFPLETVLIGKQMGLPAASGNAVIPTTYGRIYQSAASFSHGKSPLRNNRFSPQNLPNCKTNAICCACPLLFAAVRDWLGIDEEVDRPASEHPKRRIEGFECKKSEVSGKRLWGLFAERYDSPKSFFEEHFVVNYCPLVFMDEGARNVTPDKLQRADVQALQDVCDSYLGKVIEVLGPMRVVGVGGYAEDCLKRILGSETEIQISRILHPSPASPAANKDWAGQVTKQLTSAGIW